VNSTALLGWPIYAGIALVVAAVKYPKLRIVAGVAIVGYFAFSWWKHKSNAGTGSPPKE
jgi:hypothetical protein